jgi:hypothetical protein
MGKISGKGIASMAYRVKRGDWVVECDTAQEVRDLTDGFADDSPPTKRSSNGKSGHNNHDSTAGAADKYAKLLAELSGAARVAIESLAAADKELTTDDLAVKMNIEAQKIKYAMRTVQSTAGRFGISGEVIHSSRKTIGGKPKSVYWLPKQIKEALRAT